MMLTICDTSPLLYLHLVGQLELLHLLYSDIAIPPAVQSELVNVVIG
jgi:predicted nucleic acid-binding protein